MPHFSNIKPRVITLLLSFLLSMNISFSQSYFTIKELKDITSSGDKAALTKLALLKGYLKQNTATEGLLLYKDKKFNTIGMDHNNSLWYLSEYLLSDKLRQTFVQDIQDGFVPSKSDNKKWISIDKKLCLEYSFSQEYEILVHIYKNEFNYPDAGAGGNDKPLLNSRTIEVTSNSKPTNIVCKAGDKLQFRASGKITFGVFAGSGDPNGIEGFTSYNMVEGYKHGSLLGKIGNGDYFLIGTAKEYTTPNGGELQLIVNDQDPSNNSGSFTVEYSLQNSQNTSKEIKLDDVRNKEAEFPGGTNEWKLYLSKNINQKIPLKNGAALGEYIVVVSFMIDKSGNVSTIFPSTKNGYGMEDEVIRVIKASPQWTPAIKEGVFVNAYRKQDVTFIVSQE